METFRDGALMEDQKVVAMDGQTDGNISSRGVSPLKFERAAG